MIFTEFNLEDALEVRGEEKFEEGIARVNSLIQKLIQDGRQEEIERVVSDKAYQNMLFEEYGI